MPRMTNGAENTQAAAAGLRDPGECGVDDVLSTLAALGLDARVRRIGTRYAATGVTARVTMSGLFGPGEGLDRGFSLVYAALRAGIPVSVAIVDPGGKAAGDGLAYFRAKFCEFLDTAAVDRGLLGLCLSADEMPPPAFRTDIRPGLGDGPRYVVLPADSSLQRRSDTGPDAVWRLLRQTETNGPRFWPVFPAVVRSRCPLLSAERANAVLPETGIAAPLGSAWLPIHLDVCRFADAGGEIREARLERALDACIDLGDGLLDRLTWFDDRQRRDARMNRRLAVLLTGLGDLVERRGENPADLRCLQTLDRLVAGIHEGLWRRSRRLADRNGALPALAAGRSDELRRGEGHRRDHQDWRSRRRQAVTDVQVRHRNLLAMSPYSLLPRRGAASPDFGDLLPLLAHADAIAFADPPSLAHWNSCNFKSFYERMQTLVERRNAASFVAAGV